LQNFSPTTQIEHLEAMDENKRTALVVAAMKGQEEVVELLLRKGARQSARVNDEWTSLSYASQNGHDKVVDALLDSNRDTLETTDECGRTALHLAVLADKHEVVKSLLAHKANVNAQDNSGSTALHYASWNGYDRIVQTLLENYSLVSATDKHGSTPLHLASSNGHGRVVDMLIRHSADVEAADRSGRRALHQASSNGHKTVVETLLKRGALVTARDNYGRTPLDLTRTNENAELETLLLEQTTDLLKPGFFRRTLSQLGDDKIPEALHHPRTIQFKMTQKDKFKTDPQRRLWFKPRRRESQSNAGKQEGEDSGNEGSQQRAGVMGTETVSPPEDIKPVTGK
jgi:ankyrin repeat protein